jgi:predicted RNA-binding protein YlxR (DUF448 family)
MPAAQEKPKKKIPERKCVGCNERKPKNELVRVLRTPEGEIQIDRTGKKSGRGAYVCPDPLCLQAARKARRFEKAFACRIPDHVFTQMEEELSTHESR